MITGPGADEIIARQPRVDFGDSMRTGFAAMTGIEHHSPVGDWLVLGRQEAAPALADVLRSMGAEVESETLPRWPSSRRPEPSEMVTGLMLASVAAALVISRTRRHAISRLHGDSVLGAALKESLPWGCLVRIGRARADPAADPAAAVRTRSHAGHGRRARGSARAAGGRPAAEAARGSGRLGWDVRDPVLGSPANPQDGNQRGVMLWVSAG